MNFGGSNIEKISTMTLQFSLGGSTGVALLYEGAGTLSNGVA
jgi:hypothetical protein